MPEIYMLDTAVSDDGVIYKGLQSTWAAARDSVAGSVSTTYPGHAYGVRASRTSSRGGGYNYHVYRSFFQFNTRTIHTRPNSCAFFVYGMTNTGARVNCVKATAGDNLDAVDFDAIEGWVNGADNGSNVTVYSPEAPSWTIIGYNRFILTDVALDDMVANNTLQICLLHRSDLRNISPTTDAPSGVQFSEYTGTSRDPYLAYSESTDSVFFGANF